MICNGVTTFCSAVCIIQEVGFIVLIRLKLIFVTKVNISERNI